MAHEVSGEPDRKKRLRMKNGQPVDADDDEDEPDENDDGDE